MILCDNAIIGVIGRFGGHELRKWRMKCKGANRFSGTVPEVGFWTRINGCRLVFIFWDLDLWYKMITNNIVVISLIKT
jgi:hypothetical protein